MFERLTERARKVMALANQEAQRWNHDYIATEHLLLGLMTEGSGVGADVLKNLHLDFRTVRVELEKILTRGPTTATTARLPSMPAAKKVIEWAIDEARNLNHRYLGTEHILLGILREDDGIAGRVLRGMGLTLDNARAEVRRLTGSGRADDAADPQPHSGDATELAGAGERERIEKQRFDALVREAEQWARSRLLAEYVAAVRSALTARDGGVVPGSASAEWLAWAESVVEVHDPIATVHLRRDAPA